MAMQVDGQVAGQMNGWTDSQTERYSKYNGIAQSVQESCSISIFFFTQADLKEQYQTIFSEKKYYELLINNTEVDK